MNSTTGDGGAILTLVLTGVPGVGVLGGIEGGSLRYVDEISSL